MTWEMLVVLGIIILLGIFVLKIFKFVMQMTFFVAAVFVILKMVGVL